MNSLGKELDNARYQKADGEVIEDNLLFKCAVIAHHGKQFGLDTLIETGTYSGEIISRIKDEFAEIHTVELDSALYERAREKFKESSHITCYHGDSSDFLPGFTKDINKPVLFWLDAHYTFGGGTMLGPKVTPVKEELECLLAHPIEDHVILIDDAQCFDGTKDFPTTEEVKEMVDKADRNLSCEVANRIIRIYKA